MECNKLVREFVAHGCLICLVVTSFIHNDRSLNEIYGDMLTLGNDKIKKLNILS
jgi:hypothetical protein